MDITTAEPRPALSAGVIDTKALLRLSSWLSPAFPVGGFAYSGGLERAAADRLVKDGEGLRAWIGTLLDHGAPWNDGILLAEAHRATGDRQHIEELGALAAALAGGRERHDETLALGAAFIEAARSWPHPLVARLPSPLAYPVAVGAVAGAHGIALEAALAAYLNAYVGQAISAGIRLSLIGQRDGVRILQTLEDKVEAVAVTLAAATTEDLGTASILADISALKHETLSTRLFRS